MIHEPELEIELTKIRSHYSAISAHRSCPAAWHYRYVLRIKKPDFGPKPEMHFGSWWGALTAAEGLERGRKLGSLMGEPTRIQGPDDSPAFDSRTVTPVEVFNAAKAWWATRDGETKDAWVQRLGGELPYRLRDLYRSWMDKYSEQRKHEIPLGFEVFVKRELQVPHQVGEDGKHLEAVDLIGYIDEVIWDDQRGQVLIRDRKSHKQLEARTALSDMMNSQLQLYAWLGSPVIEAWGRGAPRAVGYDRARSVAPRTPELTAAGALSKGVTAYDLHTYQTWASEDTRPMKPITDWLTDAEDRILAGEKDVPSPEQLDAVREIAETPGRFWGEFGSFFVSGARKGKPKFGVYAIDQKVVDKLSTPEEESIWFQRTNKPININVVRAHLQAAADTAIDAWHTETRVARTGDAARNLGDACRWCDYADLCRARIMGGAHGEYDLSEFGLMAPADAKYLINGRLEKEPT